MFSKFKGPRGEEYEMVEQEAPPDSTASTPNEEEEQETPESGNGSRQSSDSQSSDIFQDLEGCASKSTQDNRDFHDDPLFHAVLRRYRKQGISSKVCGAISLVFLTLWLGGLILYSQLHPSQLLAKATWQTSVRVNGQNVTLSAYSPQYQNLTLDNWMQGNYNGWKESIVWLNEQQYPKTLGGGFYLTARKDSVVLKQVNSNYEENFIESRKFAYKNNFFYVEDIIANPGGPIDETSNVHLVKSNILKQWRHSSFALYWLYNPMRGTHTPIQPQPVTEETTSLVGLHFAEFSPDGKHVLFAFEHNLYIQDVSGGNLHQITQDGSPDIFNGKPDWVYEEEVVATDRMVWWSPDSSKVVFAKLDDTNVIEVDIDYYVKSVFEIGMSYKSPIGHTAVSDGGVNQYPLVSKLKYPKPGTPNPLASLYVYDVKEQTVELLKNDDGGDSNKDLGEDFLLYQAIWIDKDNFLIKETDRTSTKFARKLYRPSSGSNSIKTVHSENVQDTFGGWVEKMKMKPLTVETGNDDEDNKYVDLYVYEGKTYLALFDSPSAPEPSKIFVKHQAINTKAAFDKQENYLYFLTNVKSPMDSHLMGFHLHSEKSMEMTDLAIDAHYSAEFSQNGRFLNLMYQGPNQPWQRLVSMAEIHDQFINDDASSVREVIQHQPIINHAKQYREMMKEKNLPTVLYRQIKVNKEDIYLTVKEILPPNFDPSNNKKYPLIVHVYGGPGSQTVLKKFNVDALQILSSSLDAIVLEIEPRGTGGNDWKFKAFATERIGYWGAHDIQLVASEYIAANKQLIDAEKVAIYGWSYGGFNTLKTLELDHGDTFKYGVAIAPVTNWLFYDSVFTERIMKSPVGNENYQLYSRVNNVHNFAQTRRFLLMHGTGDDNVHFQNTMWLVDKLDVEGVTNYDMQIFPDSNHDILYDNASRILYGKLLGWLRDAFSGKFN
ncbi:uncharacterized protein LODBEIA_P16290 [Lodderomyces beijingensis]|uniref:Dipeptidyl aminopeptidase A n=1 Tax=Lodderomyces beijingensis TaxID=1775926 RepID=A0ABP0ZGW3_9ASCO